MSDLLTLEEASRRLRVSVKTLGRLIDAGRQACRLDYMTTRGAPMNRRGFLGAILAAGVAPAIIKAENAMRLWVPREPTWIGVDLGVPLTGTEILRRQQDFYDGMQLDDSLSHMRDAMRYSMVGILELHKGPMSNGIAIVSTSSLLGQFAIMRGGEPIRIR